MEIPQLSLFQRSNSTYPFGYLIVIAPQADIRTYVNDLKREFCQRYGPYESRHSKPHITISHFPLLKERQDKVLSLLQYGLSELEPFLLTLNGFGHFPNSNVIYLNVDQSAELKALSSFFLHSKESFRLGSNCTVIKNHHLTIAKSLQTDDFESACDRYLSKPYYSSFLVEKLNVFRYDPQQGSYSWLMHLKLGG